MSEREIDVETLQFQLEDARERGNGIKARDMTRELEARGIYQTI